MLEEKNHFALVLEDIQGISLAKYMNKKPLQLEEFYKLALQMTHIVGELGQHHIIHKDIKPSNFIIQPITGIIKLTDFNYSAKLTHEIQEIVPPSRLEGTLSYIAPQQTGRINMNIDFRSDFYSLGVPFYEMLTGKLPFTASDPLELIHARNTPTNLKPYLMKLV